MMTLRDVAINSDLDDVEHYEIATYRTLIAGARQMQHPQVVNLLAGILLQEEQTAKVLEGLAPSLIQKAL